MIVDGNTYCRVITPILPPEYQEVEYIESTGTQYIDTNTTIKNGTIYDINVQITQLQETAPTVGENFFIGTMSVNNPQYTLRCFVYGNNIIIQRGQFAATGVVSIQKDTNWHTYYNSKTLCKIDNTTGVPSYTITDNNLKIFLFKQNRDGFANQNSYCRIAYCKIWDDTTLVRNFIPCYRKSDNEIGMYDTVNKVFYTNQGTGTFLKGNNVVHTIRYKIPTEERPYISGHVTDGSSTFTFRVNNNADITVPVDSNGNWKWYVDRTITSLIRAFLQKNNLESITSNYDYEEVTSLKYTFRNCEALKTINFPKATFNKATDCESFIDSSKLVETVNLPKATFKIATTLEYGFCNCEKLVGLELPSAEIGGSAINMVYKSANLEDLTIGQIKTSINFRSQNKLTKQSVINIINAAAANVTYTLHSTVYNKCASGGEWHTDIQAAIDAKAQQGYTVTLISA